MGFGDHGFSMESTANYSGRVKVFDLGSLTAFTLRSKHAGSVFLCGEAACAVVLPAAADLPNGWNVMFIGHHATSATLTNTTTITGAGTNELIGHTVGGGDNGNRELQPVNPGVKDKVTLHTIAAQGDWVEITKIGSNFLVFGSSRINNGLPMA